MRYVCQFSCGAASAVAAKLTLAQYPDAEVLIVNAFVAEELDDNRRFLADCEEWLGRPIQVLRDIKYGASTHEVWRRKRYINGRHGAPCSLALKRELLASIRLPGDVNIIGYTADEEDRYVLLLERFPDEAGSWKVPLIERGLTKQDCLAIIHRAGIELPLMYRMGYRNANCVGCPKGGQAYWQAIRADFPAQFVQISNIQAQIGPGANFLRFRSGPRKNERMALSELPPGSGSREASDFTCSAFCEMTEDEID
jgi:hypothetical protein